MAKFDLSSSDKARFFKDFPRATEEAYAWAMQQMGKSYKALDEYDGWGAIYNWNEISHDSLCHNCGMHELESDRLHSTGSIVCNLLVVSPQCRYVIVTFSSRQRSYIEMFTDVGFTQVLPWARNPNTGNDICMYAFTIPEEWVVPEEEEEDFDDDYDDDDSDY
jgi:hypothetical protein